MRVSLFLAVFLSLMSGLFGALPLRAQGQVAPPANAPIVTAPAQNPPANNPNDAAPADNAPVDDAPAPDQNGAAPVQNNRSAERRAQNESRLRAMLGDFGIQEAPAQDALIAYIAEDETGKNAVRGAARRLMMAVRTGAPPDRMRDLIAIYKAAIDAEGERRRAAQNALDAKIGFSLNPRLEATLWLLGVLGESQNGLFANNFAARPPRKPGGDRNAPDGDNRNPHGHDNGGRDNGGHDNLNHDNAARRSGTVRGVVSRKAEIWVEILAEDGSVDRYWTGAENVAGPIGAANPIPTAPPNAAPLTPANPVAATAAGTTAAPVTAAGTTVATDETARRQLLVALSQVKVGARVRLDWVWNGRKCAARLEILPAEKAPLLASAQAPKTTGEAPPGAAKPNGAAP